VGESKGEGEGFSVALFLNFSPKNFLTTWIVYAGEKEPEGGNMDYVKKRVSVGRNRISYPLS